MAKRAGKLMTVILLLAVLTLWPVAAAGAALYWGSSGETVRLVQQRLSSWGYYSGPIDGVYGAKTYAAVVSFQRKNGLNADGVIGNATAAALGITLSSSSSAPVTSGDAYLLARLVYSEARGESYVGQVAVAAVVLNRVKSPLFPNTIAGVIYQRGAFTAVSDGQINLAPNSSAQRAASDAMNGWDPTGGCLYYYNPATAKDPWIYRLRVAMTIGNHVFCRV